MLPSRHRLRESSEFRAASRGPRAAGRLMVVHLKTTDADHPARVGFVVSKAVGNAVVRNRTKRRLRALMTRHVDAVPSGALLVVRARPAAARAQYDELATEASALLTKVTRRRAGDRPRAAGDGR